MLPVPHPRVAPQRIRCPARSRRRCSGATPAVLCWPGSCVGGWASPNLLVVIWFTVAYDITNQIGVFFSWLLVIWYTIVYNLPSDRTKMIVLVYNEWIGMMKFPNNKKLCSKAPTRLEDLPQNRRWLGKSDQKWRLLQLGKIICKRFEGLMKQKSGFNQAKLGSGPAEWEFNYSNRNGGLSGLILVYSPQCEFKSSTNMSIFYLRDLSARTSG